MAAAGSLGVTDLNRDGTGIGIAVETTTPDAEASGRLQIYPADEVHAVQPTDLYLRGADGKEFGPFEWHEGAEVKVGAETYRLAGAGPDSFTLCEALSGRSLGPFAATNGAQIALPGTNVTFVRAASFVSGSFAHPRLSVAKVTVALVPLTVANRQALGRMAAIFQARERQYDHDVSPVQYAMPAVRSITGKLQPPVSTPSDADIARARKQSDMGAQAAFRGFLSTVQARKVECANGRRFDFRNAVPGAYAVCAAADVRPDPEIRGVQPGVVIWWAHFDLKPYQAVDLRFDQRNARDWQTLFRPSSM